MSFVSPELTRFSRSSRILLGTEERNTSLRTDVPSRASTIDTQRLVPKL